MAYFAMLQLRGTSNGILIDSVLNAWHYVELALSRSLKIHFQDGGARCDRKKLWWSNRHTTYRAPRIQNVVKLWLRVKDTILTRLLPLLSWL
jgi:hypothetical protein